ncbi:hypothetical protein L1987_66558 [Smallanthus sonchifolius]|uniref:Uncharacterized protein n=1 Tax=Smallanthus sonchifolius TaxID=185202 RepID=A0ACB9BXF4_9ASTR|nr:hypothetical protein L1987_66558 [Smallanthus sonchifolius]
MAEKKPSGFRFRLPWLLQPALTPTREPPTQPPRSTTQTSVTSTPAQRRPFRPPGIAPAPPAAAPTTVATTAPFSPKRSPPQSAASPPQPSVSSKSSVPKSPTAKTIEPLATQPANETQATTETLVPATPPQTPPFSPPRQTQSQSSPTQNSPPPPSISPNSSEPKSPIAKTTEPVAAQPAKETQTTTETISTIATAVPSTPPLSPPTEAQSQPNPPQISPPPLPSVSPKSSVPKYPTAKTIEPLATQPAKETQATTETPGPAIPHRVPPFSPPRQGQSQPSPPQTPPPTKQSSPPTKTTSEVSEIKSSTEITGEKPREITKVKGTQTKSMDSHSTDLKSQKPKLKTATRVPLHREIKDDVSKSIHKITTSSAKQSTDEKPASVITIAGTNTGALMHLGLDVIKRGYKLNSDTTAHDSAINGDESTQRDSEAGENKKPKAIVNSNIQGINNSVMFNSSVTERNPGVHLGFYRDLANINDSIMKNTESIEMQRAEVNITSPQKLVYDPTTGGSPGGALTEPSECEFEEDDPETSGKGYEIEVL